MGSNWDSARFNDDGTMDATVYVDQVDYATCYEIHQREPQGDKYDLPAQVAKVGKDYVISIEGRPVCSMPTDNTQVIGRIKTAGTVSCTAGVKWRAYDKEPRFMVSVYLKNF